MKDYRPKAPDEITRNMSAIRSKENRTEIALRRELHRRGLRYRKYRSDLPGKPDIIFPTERIAVFVDGDYWHSRILQEKGEAAMIASIRSANSSYWNAKFKRNVLRDLAVTNQLQSSGWTVIRLWESGVKKDVLAAANRISRIVVSRRRRLVAKRA